MLLFENTFGQTPQAPDTLAALKNEGAGKKPQAAERIGNGFLRIYFSENDSEAELTALGKTVERTKAFRKGKPADYFKKCEALATYFGEEGEQALRHAVEGRLPTHTQEYAMHYATHYRVVDENVYRYRKILDFLEPYAGKKIAVAIDGKCASGKTTLARFLQKYFCADVLHTDDFYLPIARRNLAEIGGNMDFVRLKQVIAAWKSGNATYAPFDCKTQQYAAQRNLLQRNLLITEGVYSFFPQLAECFDLRILLTISEGLRVKRICAREKENAERFLSLWATREDEYFQAFAPEATADFLFDADCAD